jgi:hypothetical protein
MAVNTMELKLIEGFRSFLSKIYDNPRVISDCISRCRRVQKYEGDLWVHFDNDKGQLILERLTYTLDDVQKCMTPAHSIPIKGSKGYKSIYDGTQSLNHAVNRYFEFLNKHRI